MNMVVIENGDRFIIHNIEYPQGLEVSKTEMIEHAKEQLRHAKRNGFDKSLTLVSLEDPTKAWVYLLNIGQGTRIIKRQEYSDETFSPGAVLQQLGGNRFIAMTGAKDFVKDSKKRKIAFKVGRNSKNINYVEVQLNGKDLYDMRFYNVRKFTPRLVSSASDVYFDQLQSTFTYHTGLETHL